MPKEKSARLSVMGLGLAGGIFWGLSVLISGWCAVFGKCLAFVNMMASIYVGFEPTFIGAIVGGIWGFFNGLLAGLIFAFFYNRFRK